MGKKRKLSKARIPTARPYQDFISILTSKKKIRLPSNTNQKVHIFGDQVDNMINSEVKQNKPVNPNFFKTTMKNWLIEIQKKLVSEYYKDLNFPLLPNSDHLTQRIFFQQLLKIAKKPEIAEIVFEELNEKILQIQTIYIPHIKMRQKIRNISSRVLDYMGMITHGRIEQAFKICFGDKSTQKFKMYTLHQNNLKKMVESEVQVQQI